MSVFVLVPLGLNHAALTNHVIRQIGESDRYELPNNAGWLVSYRGTTIDLSNHLSITGQPEGVKSPIGSVLVTPITSYYGRAPTDMWEWLKVKLESST